MSILVKPLAKGTYLLRCKEKTLFSAAANGHSAIWPEALAVCDGKFVRVMRDGKQVYACNATYAALNFGVTPVPQTSS